MRTYTTGDLSVPLDRIALDAIGSEGDLVSILDVNPGLALLGLMVPARTTIFLPDRSAKTVVQPRRLFG